MLCIPLSTCRPTVALPDSCYSNKKSKGADTDKESLRNAQENALPKFDIVIKEIRECRSFLMGSAALLNAL